jgi:hypothetical protein
MKLEDIIPGEVYEIKTEVTGKMVVVVNKRFVLGSGGESNSNYPFEITAANFGITEKEILRKMS